MALLELQRTLAPRPSGRGPCLSPARFRRNRVHGPPVVHRRRLAYGDRRAETWRQTLLQRWYKELGHGTTL